MDISRADERGPTDQPLRPALLRSWIDGIRRRAWRSRERGGRPLAQHVGRPVRRQRGTGPHHPCAAVALAAVGPGPRPSGDRGACGRAQGRCGPVGPDAAPSKRTAAAGEFSRSAETLRLNRPRADRPMPQVGRRPVGPRKKRACSVTPNVRQSMSPLRGASAPQPGLKPIGLKQAGACPIGPGPLRGCGRTTRLSPRSGASASAGRASA